jgi:hypothetical protein
MEMIKRVLDYAGGMFTGLAVAAMIGAGIAQGFNIPSGTVWPGHLNMPPIGNQTPPVLSACGTAPAVSGSDVAGTVTMGTAAPTGCVITFATAYASAPNCVVNWQGTPLAAQNWTTTNAAITTVQTATSSNKLNYVCVASNVGG